MDYGSKRWNDTLIGPAATIHEAVATLNESAVQICLVVEPIGTLLGTITDGDIRRGLLRGVGMKAPVTEIMNPSPIVASPNTDASTMLEMMTQKRLRQLPLLDERRKVVGLIDINDLIKAEEAEENWVVLMAGGLGTRLRPLTDSMPKPLLEVGSKPLLETILENFLRQNFRKFYLSVKYKSQMIKEHFGDGSRWGVEIRYLEEDPGLGTAGALGLIKERPRLPLVVMNGDLLTRVNFKQLLTFHAEHRSSATMCVREYDMQVPFGVVSVEDERIIKIDEKPTHRFFVNAGIYVLDPELIDLVPAGKHLDMTSLFEKAIAADMRTTVFPIHEYWIDVGQMDDFHRANRDFNEHFGP